MNKVIILRYALYLIIGIEVLLLPKLIPVETYTTLEYYKSLSFLFPFVLLGAGNGYLFSKYSLKKDLYLVLLNQGLLLGLVVSIGFGVYYQSFVIPILFSVTLLFTIMEQKIKTDKNFILSFLFKPLISICLLIFGSLAFFIKVDFSWSFILLSSFLISLFVWILVGRVNSNILQFRLKLSRTYLKNYIHMVKKGFFATLGTLIISLFLFSDRYFTLHYYKEFLPTYSFGFNISQIVILALTTLSYISTIVIGENLQEMTRNNLRKSLVKSLLIFGGLLILLVCFVFVIQSFYEFEHILYVTLILAFFKGLFYAVSIISPIILYKGYQRKITIYLALLFLINVAGCYFISTQEFNYFGLIIFSGIVLTIYSILVIRFVFVKIGFDAVD